MVMNALFASYISTSNRLGLTFEDGRIHGVVDGIALQMWFGTYAVHVGALVPHPANLDISVAARTLTAKLAGLFGAHTEGVGDAAFDKVFAIRSSNIAAAGGLLDAEARQALLRLEAEGFHPAIDATSIHLRRFSASAAGDSDATVERDFREAALLAKILGASYGRAT